MANILLEMSPDYAKAIHRRLIIQSILLGFGAAAVGTVGLVTKDEIEVSGRLWACLLVMWILASALWYGMGRWLDKKSLIVSEHRNELLYFPNKVGALSLTFSPEDPLVIRKNASGKRWLLTTSSQKKRKNLRLPVAAFPDLDAFLKECFPYCEVAE